VKEVCDAGHAHGFKIDLYFSHPDWYDLDFRPYGHHPVLTEEAIERPRDFETDISAMFSGRVYEVMDPDSPEESARMMERHRAQLLEILGNYGEVDMCCLDIRLGPANWPHVKETIKMLRELHPNVMFRNRGIGNYGDYYTPEGYVPEDPSNTNMPWMVIYPLGRSFAYEPVSENHKGTKWVVHNLVDTVAKGGNFMVGIGPDGDGRFHPEAIKQLEAAGEWIKVNGEGIFGTRPWSTAWKEGESIRFMATKDGSTVFAFVLDWPEDNTFRSSIVRPKEGSEIHMLGVDGPLDWSIENDELVIPVGDEIASNRPCEFAWGFQILI
jgi:alpha-L-fucosidase